MCIRDRYRADQASINNYFPIEGNGRHLLRVDWYLLWRNGTCLLYTSDAADERSSVDLGGRRII